MGAVKNWIHEKFVEPLEQAFFDERGVWPEGDDAANLWAIGESLANDSAKALAEGKR